MWRRAAEQQRGRKTSESDKDEVLQPGGACNERAPDVNPVLTYEGDGGGGSSDGGRLANAPRK